MEAEFGTLCHAVIEYNIKNDVRSGIPEDYKKILLAPFEGSCSSGELSELSAAADSLAAGFFSSDLWKKAASSRAVESELAFTSSQVSGGREIYINGIIDLLIETEEQVMIVDFKTDNELRPGNMIGRCGFTWKPLRICFQNPQNAACTISEAESKYLLYEPFLHGRICLCLKEV